MKKVYVILGALTCLCLLSAAALQAKDIKVPRDYATIQAAIAAANPGDKIKVEKGTYFGQIIITKALSIEGSDDKKTIIDGQGLQIAQTGQVRITAPGDVVFKGFTIQNIGYVPIVKNGNPLKLRVGIYGQSNNPAAVYLIRENSIIGTNDPNEEEDYGFYSHSGKESLIFTHNDIKFTGANSVLLEKHSGATEVIHNKLGLQAYPCDVYFNMNYGGPDITTPQVVAHNKIDMDTTGGYDANATGVTFAAGFTGGAGGFTQVEISHNDIFHIIGYSRRGVGLWNNANVQTANNILAVIEHNKIGGNKGEDLYRSYGIDTIGWCKNVRIAHNEINFVHKGIFLRQWLGANAEALTISENNIKAYLGIELEAQAKNNQITKNHVDGTDAYIVSALPPYGLYAVILGLNTNANLVAENHLKTDTLKGNPAVQDLGVNNQITKNK